MKPTVAKILEVAKQENKMTAAEEAACIAWEAMSKRHDQNRESINRAIKQTPSGIIIPGNN